MLRSSVSVSSIVRQDGTTGVVRTVCSLCCKKIVDGKEDALFCEGTCRAWMHRYCAGVSVDQFQSLSSSPAPFHCSVCALTIRDTEIASLKAAVVAQTEEIKELRSEIQQLKLKFSGAYTKCADNVKKSTKDACISNSWQTLDKWTGEAVCCTTNKKDDHQEGWTHTGRGNRRGGRGGGWRGGLRGSGGLRGRGGRGGSGSGGERGSVGGSNYRYMDGVGGQGNGREEGAKGLGLRRRVPVENAKKIWGTLKFMTSSVVIGAIGRLTSVTLAQSLKIKRKYKMNPDGSIKKWWFVVRAEKESMEKLEKEWEKVSLQTGWKLEQVLQFEDSRPAPISTPPTTQTLEVLKNSDDKAVIQYSEAADEISSNGADSTMHSEVPEDSTLLNSTHSFLEVPPQAVEGAKL